MRTPYCMAALKILCNLVSWILTQFNVLLYFIEQRHRLVVYLLFIHVEMIHIFVHGGNQIQMVSRDLFLTSAYWCDQWCINHPAYYYSFTSQRSQMGKIVQSKNVCKSCCTISFNNDIKMSTFFCTPHCLIASGSLR